MHRRVILAFSAAVALGAALAGCGSTPARHHPDAVGYIDGVAIPCVGMVVAGPLPYIELRVSSAVLGSFVEPTTWIAGVHHFRFAVPPGSYRVLEEQRYSGRYERVGGPFAVHVDRGVTTNITVGNVCK